MSQIKSKSKQEIAPEVLTESKPVSERETASVPDLANDLKIAHYSASVQAWFGTKIEKDKSLLTLASAGIGLLVSFGATSKSEKFLFALSILFFITTVFCSLAVFEINAKLIEDIIQKKNSKRTGEIARTVDRILVICFFLGIIFFALLGTARFMNW